MKKLIIKVTPEQSRIAQEILFKAGYSWARSGVTVANTSGAYLALNICQDKALTYSSSLSCWTGGIEVIKFEDWFKKYNPIDVQRAKVAKHQAKLDLMIQEKIAADLKSSKVELKGGDWYVCTTTVDCMPTTDSCRNFGIERQTKELAESARKEIIRFQRMLAYVDDRGARLRDGGCTVVVSRKGEYSSTDVNPFTTPCVIRMTEDCAKQLADDLNQGRFTLDLE